MRRIDNSDFEAANIEYIEFWLMDPFLTNPDAAYEGGDLYIDLGDISEDILRDGKKAFEKAIELGVRDKVKIMIGGAPVNEDYCKKIGADIYTPDAASAADAAVEFCKG